MARLTKDERDYITSQLMKPIEKEIEDNTLKLAEAIDCFCLSKIPEDFLKILKLYPSSVKARTVLYESTLFPSSPSSSFISPIKYFIEGFHKENEVRQDLEVDRLYKLRTDLKKKKKALKGRVQCIIENISTENKLKNEFPEAYVILLKRYEVGSSEGSQQSQGDFSNLCDSIENVRAELFGKTK